MVSGSSVMWLKNTSEKASDTTSICRKTASRQGLDAVSVRRGADSGAALGRVSPMKAYTTAA